MAAGRGRTTASDETRRGMAIWVGDLFGADLGDALRALDRLRYSRHELAVLQIRDPGEAEAGEPGEYEVEDCETGAVEKVIVDAGMNDLGISRARLAAGRRTHADMGRPRADRPHPSRGERRLPEEAVMIIERTENPQWLSNAYLVAD